LKKSILDPQGKVVHHALQSFNLAEVEQVRIGKMIEMNLNCSTQKEAERITEEACKKLLANPIMENYSYTIEEIE
jgi:phosphoribosylformylglycinamidine synthase PurS subunit